MNNSGLTNKSSLLVFGALFFLLVVAAAFDGQQRTQALSGASQQGVGSQKDVAVSISPTIPLEVADPSNLQAAAIFAWGEFAALTWPAQAQGPASFPRGKPQPDGTYGKAGPTGQVVFETFRHKVEVFPGGSGVNPNGYDPTKADFGFSSLPLYRYDPNTPGVQKDGTVPPAPTVPPQKVPSIPPYNNLDEVTQISLNAMYAGTVNPHPNMGGSSKTDVQEKILFQAKVNETHYAYVARNKFWGLDANPNLQTILTNSGSFVQTGDAKTYPGPYMNLPASVPAAGKVGTIEIKTAWRRVNTKLEDPSRFYTARVRYYVGSIDNMGNKTISGWVDSDQVGETWGLVALHIIQKTPNAPAFIYATFGHIDNILDPGGNSVEAPDGTTKPPYVNAPPFLPALNITPAPDTIGGVQREQIAGSTPVNTNNRQLYYHNVSGKEVTTNPDGSLYTGPVNVNRRLFMIPPVITAANQAAHQAIRAVNPNAVWLNYRLVNVQARPIDLDNVTPADEPTYYLANEVVETNPSLQHFRGGLNVAKGTIFDYSRFIFPQQPGKDYNTFVVVDPTKPVIRKYLMGGCMGCHGSQGQKQGGDFSVILANGRVASPDIIQEDEAQNAIMQAKAWRYGKPMR